MVAKNITIDHENFAVVAHRFWSKVLCRDTETDTCWHWHAMKNHDGYGRIKIGGQWFMAHRVAWVLTYGTIDPRLTIDHLCRNHACVNPGHLELVTTQVNTLRGENFIPRYARRLACKHGHAYTVDNTRIDPTTSGRRCRTCDRIMQARHRRRTHA